jgi:hypothetical protein
MASPLNTLSMSPEQLIMQQYEALNRQQAALQQPVPQQGGFLSGADPVMLSLAAGLLSPTKTGGFGESVAAGLSAASGPLSEIRKQEAARADKMSALQSAQAKLAMDLYEIRTGGGRRGYRPEDPNLIYNRYLDNRARLKAEIEAEQDPKEAERLRGQLATIDKEAENIFPAKVQSGDNSGDPSQGGSGKKDPLAGVEHEGPYPKILTEEQYDALPSGTRYIHPKTGTQKIKP